MCVKELTLIQFLQRQLIYLWLVLYTCTIQYGLSSHVNKDWNYKVCLVASSAMSTLSMWSSEENRMQLIERVRDGTKVE